MEPAYHRLLEAVGLHYCPPFQLVGRDVLHIAGHILRSVGVGAVGTDCRHHLVILVGNGQFRCLETDGVYAVVESCARNRVGRLPVGLEQSLDFIEHRLLAGIVHGAEMRRALEHKMLEIVRKPGGFSRVVLAAHAHRYVSLDARLTRILRHEHLQPVGQRVDFCVQRVARHTVVGILRRGGKLGKPEQGRR